MNPFYESILYVIVLVLLPIIPAYFLFKALPSRADVSGPLKGLTVKLGGAFAGYFLLFLVLPRFFPPPTHLKPYTLRGQLVLGVDSTAGAERWRDFVRFTVEPEIQNVGADGRFYVKFPYNPRSKEWSETSIYLDGGPCGTARVAVPGLRASQGYGVTAYSISYDEKDEMIYVREPVKLMPRVSALDSASIICAGGPR
ncbi:MAG TPA: hypothetical protein VEW03_13210 [Longimicrobiaceae bacterium]|nr:hypothetical protein [Longimicrobiaceae bacterium]